MTLRQLLNSAFGGIIALAFFSFAVNILTLVQPIYLLQIYDRVLPSASFDTLVFISIMAASALVLFGFLDSVRAVIASRVASRIEANAGAVTLVASMSRPQARDGDVQPLRDLSTVRNFVGGRALLAYFDLPFVPLYVLILYFVHPHLFWLTLFGTVVLSLIAIANERAAAAPSGRVARSTISALTSAQSFARSSESIRAMGMMQNAVGIWGGHASEAINSQDDQNWRNALFSGISRALRLALQLSILGYGCFLVLNNEMTAGMIFASSLISSRAMQPIDQVIGGWRAFVETRRAWHRLREVVGAETARSRSYTALPAPKGEIMLRDVVVFPGRKREGEPVLKRITFGVRAGECIAIVGPSGGGKSTLVRTIIGAVRPASGKVTVDGSELRDWDPEQLGREMGYVSQNVELLPGTIKQNIARFMPGASDEDVISAAEMAHAHDLIKGTPQGYDTLLGSAEFEPSGGQKQRIALARAFFGNPRIIVLDEPNSSLDPEGEDALAKALGEAKAGGATIIMVTQRRTLASAVDKVLVLHNGNIENYGYKREVMAWLAGQRSAAASADNVQPIPVRPAPAGQAPAADAAEPESSSNQSFQQSGAGD